MTELQQSTIAVAWLFMVFAIIAVILRLVSRFVLKKAGGWDDVIIIISLLIYLGTTICLTIGITKGLCRHITTFTEPELVEALKWLLIIDGIGLFSFTVPKLSVAILLVRIGTLQNKGLNVRDFAICTPAIFVIAWSFAAFGLWLGQCDPIQAQWDKAIPGADCMNPKIFADFSTALGACSAAVDFFYAIYPVYIISRLQTSLNRKIHLCIVLGLGAICGAFAVWKTVASRETTDANADLTYSASSLFISNQVEAGLLIVAACIPTIGPVVRLGVNWTKETLGSGRSERIESTVEELQHTKGSNKMVV